MTLRSLASFLALVALAGCADWFEPDTGPPCTPDPKRVEVSPSYDCLALLLRVDIDPDAGAWRIEGKNTCSDALTVVSADGGSTVFPVGSIIVVPLDATPTTTQGQTRRWTFEARLGSDPVTLTATNGC